MNGATTEPCASARSPPRSTLTRMIGSSQNLRRTPRNRHIWNTKSIRLSLEKVPEAVVVRTGRVAALPVGRRGGLEAAGHRVAADGAHDQRGGREHAKENDAHHHRAHHVVQELAE